MEGAIQTNMMNDSNEVINAEALSIVPAKRKRGRPRKYPSLDDPSSFPDGGDEFHVSSGYRGSNGTKFRQVDAGDVLRDGVTGQAVSGFLEGEFDGGYLLTVRVRNSDTLLRGVVFKPGRFVPVSADNDVAPNAQMIKRNERPLHSEHYSRSHGGSHARHRERNGVAYHLASPTAGSVGLKSRVMSPIPLQAVSPADPTGNMAPLVVQPVSSSNDGALTQNQMASAGNLDSHNLSPTLSEETQPVALQVVHPVVQPTLWGKEVPESTEKGIHDEQGKEALEEAETKPVIWPPIRSSENLEIELVSPQTSPQVASTDSSEAAVKSGSVSDDRIGAGEQPTMFVEPFHAIQPNLMNLSNSEAVPKILENERAGRMTELLQVCVELKNYSFNPLCLSYLTTN
ncbi:hypothetical protein SAY87_031680 [Trapa incisa]|uniref:Uncharacterized protein n=1 Tax=Trapa incisa TaxID=236973 RepID=A0AAN7KKZ4_9MYRT|nr:hypothetical protein SAY87_031680 [Trapa incisa]